MGKGTVDWLPIEIINIYIYYLVGRKLASKTCQKCKLNISIKKDVKDRERIHTIS